MIFRSRQNPNVK